MSALEIFNDSALYKCSFNNNNNNVKEQGFFLLHLARVALGAVVE